MTGYATGTHAAMYDEGKTMIFTILPQKGILWDQHMILLGAKKNDVEEKLGFPQSVFDHSYYYFESNIRFDFSPNGELEFIEFLGGITGTIQPVIFGVQAFQVDADVLYQVLKEKMPGKLLIQRMDIRMHFPIYELAFIENRFPTIFPHISEKHRKPERISRTIRISRKNS